MSKVTIIGNVSAEDDYTHELGPEENFNESVYFNFFDRNHSRGGFIRMGNRANEGHAEMTVLVFNPDGSGFFYYDKPAISHNDGWDAGGARVDVIEPGYEIRTRYEGKALHMQDPRDMKDPSSAFKSNPFRNISIDLIHQGVGPLYGHVGDASSKNQFSRAHYEQHMRVTGTIHVEGEDPIEFNGHGLRDHSWGPRFWQAARSYRWITGNFGDDLGMVIKPGRTGTMFHKGHEYIRATSVELQSEYETGDHFHRGFSAKVQLENGDSHTIEATVKGFIPLRNRRSGKVTYIGEGMTEYVLDGDRIGYGLSEYLDQPDAPLDDESAPLLWQAD